MVNTIIEQILEEGGIISWRSKYFLMMEEKWNSNPDKEWKGYTINQLNIYNEYQSFCRNMNLNNILDNFYNLIEEEMMEENNRKYE